MNLEGFPKKDDVKSSISKLDRLGFPLFKYGKDDIDDFVERISNILLNEFGILPNILQFFKNNEFSLSFYRAREVGDYSNINLIREHSYPPINIVGMGRCNFPEYPVFYSSNSPLTALLEVTQNYGSTDKKYCISKWEIVPLEEQLVFQSFLQSQLPPENNFRPLKQNLMKRINEPFQKSLKKTLDKEREEGLLEYLKYLDTSFISDNTYSLSATLAHRAFYDNHNYRTDILMYPSTQSMYKGVNLALHPNFVDNNLRLSRLYIVKLENNQSNTNEVRVTFSNYAEVYKNVVFWEKIKKNDQYFAKLVKEDFGEITKNEFK